MWCFAAGLTDPDVSKETNIFKIAGSVNQAVQQTTQRTKILNINNVETSNLIYLISVIGIKFFTTFLYTTKQKRNLHTCTFSRMKHLLGRFLSLSFISSYSDCAPAKSILLTTSIAGLSKRSSRYSSSSYTEYPFGSLYKPSDTTNYIQCTRARARAHTHTHTHARARNCSTEKYQSPLLPNSASELKSSLTS